MPLKCGNITVEDVVKVAFGEEVHVPEESFEIAESMRAQLLKRINEGHVIYGVNTGVGELVHTVISREMAKKLQKNIIRSHCCGVGEYFTKEAVRAAMFIRLNNLIKGYSGVSAKTLRTILEFLNKDIVPLVPSRGSVGASGDLAPLAHIALALLGEGEVTYEGKIMKAGEVMEELGIKPIDPQEKEGLALINGTSFMSALGCLAVYYTEKILKNSLVAAMMTFESLRGNPTAYDEKLLGLRPHKTQMIIGKYLRTLLEGYSKKPRHVQDAYSLRCIPQVYSSVLHAINNLREILNVEINSVTDNPVIMEGESYSGGNFHGEIIANALDYLAIALADMGNMIERRIYRLLDSKVSGLPPFLAKDSGLNSGLMLIQYTSAALCNENKALSYPSSVDTIPTSAGQEDHVSMGMTSALKLMKILDNLWYLVAMEYFTASQALEFEPPTAHRIIRAHQEIREIVPPVTEDRVYSKDIENIVEKIKDDFVLRRVWDF